MVALLIAIGPMAILPDGVTPDVELLPDAVILPLLVTVHDVAILPF